MPRAVSGTHGTPLQCNIANAHGTCSSDCKRSRKCYQGCPAVLLIWWYTRTLQFQHVTRFKETNAVKPCWACVNDDGMLIFQITFHGVFPSPGHPKWVRGFGRCERAWERRKCCESHEGAHLRWEQKIPHWSFECLFLAKIELLVRDKRNAYSEDLVSFVPFVSCN